MNIGNNLNANQKPNFGMNLKILCERSLTPEFLETVSKAQETVSRLEPLDQDIFILNPKQTARNAKDLFLALISPLTVGQEIIKTKPLKNMKTKQTQNTIQNYIEVAATTISEKYLELKNLEEKADPFIYKGHSK